MANRIRSIGRSATLALSGLAAPAAWSAGAPQGFPRALEILLTIIPASPSYGPLRWQHLRLTLATIVPVGEALGSSVSEDSLQHQCIANADFTVSRDWVNVTEHNLLLAQ